MDTKDFPSILLHGARGTGLWEALLEAAAGLLCERAPRGAAPWQARACGECAGCHLWRSGTHPDLRVLVPPALAAELGLGSGQGASAADAGAEKGGDKRSASAGREISIDDVRSLIDWAQGTSHRGGAKVAVVHQLDAMAAPAANALLKVLEEPPPGLCFLTGTYQLERVLPTLRSRCSLRAWARPAESAALEELQRRGEADAQAVARWCRQAVFDTEPARGLEWARALLRQAAAGRQPGSDGVTPAVAIEALQKLTVDMLRARSGLEPLYLPGFERELGLLGRRGTAGAWQAWWQRLNQAARVADFPLHAGLATQAWVVEWMQLCNSGAN